MKQRDKQSIVADALADIAVVCGFVAWAALAGTVWWKLESVDVKPETRTFQKYNGSIYQRTQRVWELESYNES